MQWTDALRMLEGHPTLRSGSAREVAELLYEIDRSAIGPASQDPVPFEPSLRYPTDRDGFAVAYDPVSDTDTLRSVFARYGFVVARSVVSEAHCDALVGRAKEIVRTLSPGFDLDDRSTWHFMPRDSEGTPVLSRGFLEIYHDEAWAAVRQSERIFLLWCALWGTTRIWTSFDRLGVKPPSHESSNALPLHVDQNPLHGCGFRTVQGILALKDCPVELGTTVLVPNGHSSFSEWSRFAPVGPTKHYVTLEPFEGYRDLLGMAQPVPIRKGDLVAWDSRTPHANSPNRTLTETRWVALIGGGVAQDEDPEIVAERKRSVEYALGWNSRRALLHASSKPRYSATDAILATRMPESLSGLGELLYGVAKYGGSV
jgi:hypothetical protein